MGTCCPPINYLRQPVSHDFAEAAAGNTNKGRMHTGGRERQPESKFRQQHNVPNAEKTETPKSNPTQQSKSDYKRPVESRADPEVVADYQRRVRELRDKFMRSIMKEKGNIGIADINIEGIDSKTMATHSKNSIPNDLLVGNGKTRFDYLNLPSIREDGRPTNSYPRNTDAEYKLLSNIADKLGDYTSIKGEITIFSEKSVCTSCSGVAQQFKSKYPNITLRMIDRNGSMLTF